MSQYSDLELLGHQLGIALRLNEARLRALDHVTDLTERLTKINQQHRDAVDEMVMLRHQLQDTRTRHRKATRLVAHLRRKVEEHTAEALVPPPPSEEKTQVLHALRESGIIPTDLGLRESFQAFCGALRHALTEALGDYETGRTFLDSIESLGQLRRDYQRTAAVLASIRAERDDLRARMERSAGGKKLRRRLEKANAALETTRDQIAAAHREIDKCGSGLGGTALPDRVRALVYRWEFERKRADNVGQELMMYQGYKARVEELREQLEGVRTTAARDRRALEDERRVRQDMIAAAVRMETSALTGRVGELEALLDAAVSELHETRLQLKGTAEERNTAQEDLELHQAAWDTLKED